MKAIERFECGDCAALHEKYQDAFECCAPYPDEVYLCGQCMSCFELESEAEACCIVPDGEPLVERCQHTLELPL